MGQPVKLSEELVLDARLAGKAGERSIALVVKIDQDGKRTVGRFVNREFRPSK